MESDIMPSLGPTNPFDDDESLLATYDDLDTDVEFVPTRRGQNETADDFGDDLELAEVRPEDADAPRHAEDASRSHLMRERQLRQEAERNAILNQEAADRQVFEAEKRSLTAQREAMRLAMDGIDVRIRTATEALKLARQDGDTSAETDIEIQLNQLRELRRDADSRNAQLPSDQALEQTFLNHINQRRAQYQSRVESEQSGARPLNRMADAWSKANASWFNSDSQAMTALTRINEALVQEGYDANKAEFYAELTRRMARANPGLAVKNYGQRNGGQQRATPPVAGGRSVAPGVGPNGKRRIAVEYGATDMRLMQKLGLDPANPDHRGRWLKEKADTMKPQRR